MNKALCALGMVEGRMQGVITVRFCVAEDMQAGDPEGVARCGHWGPCRLQVPSAPCIFEAGDELPWFRSCLHGPAQPEGLCGEQDQDCRPTQACLVHMRTPRRALICMAGQ